MTALERFAGLVESQAALRARLGPPATEEELATFLRELGVSVPAVFVEFFRGFNGGSRPVWDAATETFVGSHETLFDDETLTLESLDSMVGTKRSWDEWEQEFRALAEADREESSRLALWHPSWVPFASSEAEILALATEPCFGGPANQVVWFDFKGHCCWEVRHASFEAWLRTLTECCASGCDAAVREAVQRTLNPEWRYIEFSTGDDRFQHPGTRF